MSEQKIPIPAMLYNAAVGGHVTNSQQIIDENLNREQNDINQETVGAVPYNSTTPNGMGRIVLKKNDNFKQVVEAQTNGNTIFVIKYDFTLTDDVTIPENCILEFDGGSIDGQTIDFNNCVVIGSMNCLRSNLNFIGIKEVHAEWFGITPESSDISTAFNALVQRICSNYGNTLYAGIDSVSIVFKKEVYHTSSTLNIVGNGTYPYPMVNIIGFPTFYLDSATTTCVKISRGNRNTYQFNVGRVRPAIWKNMSSIGVETENCTNCKFEIPRIEYFTIGFIARAKDNIGYAWNNIYFNLIYASLHSFVIESLTQGWPNANTVYGGAIMWNSGWFDMTDATQPRRDVVFKGDGTYGANGWAFIGLWLESHNTTTINGDKGYAIDFCDYLGNNGGSNYGVSGITFDNCRIEYTHPAFKIDSRSCGKIAFNATTMIGTKTNYFAVDYDGTEISNKEVFSIVDEKKIVELIDYTDGYNDIVGFSRELIGQSGFRQYLSKKDGIVGIGSNKEISPTFGAFGFTNASKIIKDIKGVLFSLKFTGRIGLYFFDKNFNFINTSAITIEKGTDAFATGNGYCYAKQDGGYSQVLFKISASDNSGVKYMLIGMENNVTKINVCALSTVASLYILNNHNHDGIFYNKAFVRNNNAAIASQRMYFLAGEQYYNEDSGTLSRITKSGSLGNIGTVTVSGISGSYEVTANDVSKLIVGDFVTISSTEYIIRDINTTDKILLLNKAIGTTLTDEPLTLTPPTYE